MPWPSEDDMQAPRSARMLCTDIEHAVHVSEISTSEVIAVGYMRCVAVADVTWCV